MKTVDQTHLNILDDGHLSSFLIPFVEKSTILRYNLQTKCVTSAYFEE